MTKAPKHSELKPKQVAEITNLASQILASGNGTLTIEIRDGEVYEIGLSIKNCKSKPLDRS